MEGAQRALDRALDIGLHQAWHGELFARMKLSKFKHALKEALNRDKPKTAAAQAVAFFGSLQAKGLDVKIYKTPRV